MAEPHRLTVRVYYEDTDFSGVVYHANYLRFFERGRTEYLRDRGVEQAALRDTSGQPLAFAVRRIAIDFMRPARMDDLLTVVTSLAEITGASLRLDQTILRGGDVLASAEVQVVMVGEGRPRRLPLDLVTRLR